MMMQAVHFLLVAFMVLSANGLQSCRSRGLFLKPEEFNAETCALCYIYMPITKFKTVYSKWNLTNEGQRLISRTGARLSNGHLNLTVCHFNFCPLFMLRIG